jgi:hypothetical protein
MTFTPAPTKVVRFRNGKLIKTVPMNRAQRRRAGISVKKH